MPSEAAPLHIAMAICIEATAALIWHARQFTNKAMHAFEKRVW